MIMKSVLFLGLILTSLIFSTCKKKDVSSSDTPCGTHNGKQLYKGPQDGCYYINSNGNKTYVDKSECNC